MPDNDLTAPVAVQYKQTRSWDEYNQLASIPS